MAALKVISSLATRIKHRRKMINQPEKALCVLELFLKEIYENSSSRIQKKDRNGISGCEFCQEMV
jgi:hypothetical protein